MLRKFIKICSFTMLVMGLPTTNVMLFAQNVNDKIPVDPKVKIGKLPNGMKYYIRSNGKPEKKVELRLVVNAGSILENEDQRGLAHFMEHMSFNGTKNFPENKLVDYLQSIGVEFGADLNAYTSFDETVYILPVPTDNPKNLETGFQILRDWAQNANLTDKDINEERAVVLEESRLGKGADDRMMNKYLPSLLAGSKYASRLPIGKDEILKTFKPQVIKDFYRDWYRPNLMSVMVVGDITNAEAEALITKYFSDMKNPTAERPRTVSKLAPYNKSTAMVLSDKEATNTIFQLIFSSKDDKITETLGDYRDNIVKSLFTQIINSRLQELSRSAKPPFIYAGTGLGEFLVRNQEALSLTVVPSDDVTASIQKAIGELVKIKQFGINKGELEIAKKNILNNIEQLNNEKNNTNSANIIDEYVRNFLKKESMPGIENEYKYYQKFVPEITLEELNKVGAEWLNTAYLKNYFALMTGPTSNIKMTDPQLKALVDKSFQQKVVANEDKIVSDNLLDKQPTAGTITGLVKDNELQTTTFTLSNGVKVTIKPTDFKNDEIILSAVKKGGKSNYGVEDKGNLALLGDAIESMGYGKFNPTQLTDALSGKTVSLVPTINELTVGLSGSASVKDLPSLLELTYLQLTEPKLDTELLNGFKTAMKSQLQFLSSNPQMAFVDTFTKYFYNNNPNAPVQIPTVALVEQLDAKRAVDIYKKEFSNADGFHFFITGNVDENTIKPLLEKYIASLPTKGTTPTFSNKVIKKKEGVNRFEFQKGQDAKALLLSFQYGDKKFSEIDALKANLLADVLTIKVIENVREKMGAIYGGSVSAQMNKYPSETYTISGQFPCGPENVDPIIKELNHQIDDIKKVGPTQIDLDKAILAIIEKRKENIKTNMYWNNKLEQLLFWDQYSKDYFLNFDSRIHSITVKDIQETAKELLNNKNVLNAILVPEIKK